MEIELQGESIVLLPQKAVFLTRLKTLLVADLHIGKIGHFRRSGIPVPPQANEKNMEILIDLMNATSPEKVIFLGDLFHSHYNQEWEALGQVLKHFSACAFELVRGNHDIMSAIQYERNRIRVFEKELPVGPFLLTHEPVTGASAGYNLAGHLHPGARLVGKGRQALSLPCFYFGKKQGILPAFGSFTGLAHIAPEKGDRVFVIADGKIMQV